MKLTCLLIAPIIVLTITRKSTQASVPEGASRRSGSQTMREVKNRGSPMADAFVFPGETETRKKDKDNLFMPTVGKSPPPCANGSTFCEYVDEYPTEHVMALLRKEGHNLNGFFTNDEIDTNKLENRIDPLDENPLCPSREDIKFPQLGKTKDGDWMYLINNDNYKQGVRIETCVHQGECAFAENFPPGYKAECRQHYIYRSMLALDKNGSSTKTERFQLPSCCKCVVKIANSIHNRMAPGVHPLALTLPKTTPVSVVNPKRN